MTLLFRRNLAKLKILKLATEVQTLNNIFLTNQFNHVIKTHIDTTYQEGYKINCSCLSEICEKSDEKTLNNIEKILKDF